MTWMEQYVSKLRSIQNWKPWIVVVFGIVFTVSAFVREGMQGWERAAVALSGLGSAAWGVAWLRQSRTSK